MGNDHFSVEGVRIDTLSLGEAATRICDDVSSGPSFSVFTLNLDHVVKLRRDRAFRRAYESAKVVLADGFPIALAGRLQGKNVSRTAGSDLIEPLCAEASRRGVPLVFLGSSFAAIAGAARELYARHPGLEIAGVLSPPMGFNPNSAAEEIAFVRDSGARICLVALGAPKQELFAYVASRETEQISFVCIGAGLDFISGHQTRAPKIVRQMHGEWLWRLASNPRRLGRRYLDCLLVIPSLLAASLANR